jgi:hypothetical protein
VCDSVLNMCRLELLVRLVAVQATNVDRHILMIFGHVCCKPDGAECFSCQFNFDWPARNLTLQGSYLSFSPYIYVRAMGSRGPGHLLGNRQNGCKGNIRMWCASSPGYCMPKSQVSTFTSRSGHMNLTKSTTSADRCGILLRTWLVFLFVDKRNPNFHWSLHSSVSSKSSKSLSPQIMSYNPDLHALSPLPPSIRNGLIVPSLSQLPLTVVYPGL